MSSLRVRAGKRTVGYAGKPGIVYLLHFQAPYRHCRHYIGFTERPLAVRLGEHWRGNGSSLTAAALGQPSNRLVLARVWPHVASLDEPFDPSLLVDQGLEMVLKCRAEGPALCPTCNPMGAARLARYYTKPPKCPNAWSKGCRGTTPDAREHCPYGPPETCPDARFLYVHPKG